jgi:DNA-binding transcriptional LysR family regulator
MAPSLLSPGHSQPGEIYLTIAYFAIISYLSLMNITLRQLKAFVAVADTGNFTRAARRLHVAQSAISLMVRELEDELGVRLFDRTTRHVELTDPGREFSARAQKLIADLEHAVRQTQELVERKRGRIAVAAPPFLATFLLPRVIAEFCGEFPGVRVVLIDARTDQLLTQIKSGEADIAIGTFAADEDGIARTLLTRDELMLFSSQRHAMASARAPSWADLANASLIVLSHESAIRALVEDAFAAMRLSFAPAFEVAQITTALALVEAGLGVSPLPAYALAAIGSRHIIGRTLRVPVVSRNIEIISSLGRTPPPATSEFVSRLRRQIQAMMPQLVPAN